MTKYKITQHIGLLLFTQGAVIIVYQILFDKVNAFGYIGLLFLSIGLLISSLVALVNDSAKTE